MRIAAASLCIGVTLLAGCASAPTPPPPVAPATVTGPALAGSASTLESLDSVLWTQRAVEHDLVLQELFRGAKTSLLRALSDPTWDALPHEERTGSYAGLPAAVIVDVDETMLDNSPFEARRIHSGELYNEAIWGEWCKEEAARALPGALDFARFADAHGAKVYYLTNRAKDLGPATLANLRKAGFPVADDAFLGLGELLQGCEQVGSDKGCRRQLIARGHRVLMQLGDQVGDFVDVVANTPDGRARAIAPYADWIGERWIVLPNPMYGSWQAAVFNNDFSQPPAAQQRAKIDALRTDQP